MLLRRVFSEPPLPISRAYTAADTMARLRKKSHSARKQAPGASFPTSSQGVHTLHQSTQKPTVHQNARPSRFSPPTGPAGFRSHREEDGGYRGQRGDVRYHEHPLQPPRDPKAFRDRLDRDRDRDPRGGGGGGGGPIPTGPAGYQEWGLGNRNRTNSGRDEWHESGSPGRKDYSLKDMSRGVPTGPRASIRAPRPYTAPVPRTLPPLPPVSWRGGYEEQDQPRSAQGSIHQPRGTGQWGGGLSRDSYIRSDHKTPASVIHRPQQHSPRQNRDMHMSRMFHQGIDKGSRFPPSPQARFSSHIRSVSPPAGAPKGPGMRRNELLVPKPTEAYLTKSLESTRVLTDPQDLLIILDLNGTLLFRRKIRSGSSRQPVPRPGLGAFLRYIFSNFKVMVWSSAQPENVRSMVKALFLPEQEKKLLGIWARDTLGLNASQYNQKMVVYKKLERVWEGVHRIPKLEGDKREWDQTNTLLMDDSVVKACKQPFNHLEVTEFMGTDREIKQDKVLYEAMAYLEEAKWQANISSFVRQLPFKADGRWLAGVEDVLKNLGINDDETSGTSEASSRP